MRNDQLYDELVSRAGELERAAGLVHGSFAQRPASWLRYGPWRVEHRFPIGLVYASTAALWAYLFVRAAFPRWQLLHLLTIDETLLAPTIVAPALVVAVWLLLRLLGEMRERK